MTENTDITVGEFTYHAETETISGPKAYVEEGHLARVVAEVAAGTKASFNHNPHAATHPIRSLLVSVQTDYAGWRGYRDLFGSSPRP